MKDRAPFLSLVVLLMLCLLPAFAAKVTLARVPDQGIQPQAVQDERGVVHLIYFKGEPAAGDIYYVRRASGMSEFSKPIKVNSGPPNAIAIGTIRGAQLALGKNGRVHVAWNGPAPAHGGYLEAPMLYTRMNDAGTAFEPERNLIHTARGLDGGGSVAADRLGNVYVMWHAPEPGNTNGESGRALFVARSSDDGKTFAPETRVLSKDTGACACCGMRAFADQEGNVFAWYRGAADLTNRNEILLVSRDHGMSFDVGYEHGWKISSCPMSSAFLSEAKTGILAAAETHGRVYFVRVDAKTGKVSEPVSPELKGKFPVVLANQRGEVLLVWIEGVGWGKGGSVAWQMYGPDGQAEAEVGRAQDVPAWSMAAAFAERSGDFVIVY
jgi:hypothetical protein